MRRCALRDDAQCVSSGDLLQCDDGTDCGHRAYGQTKSPAAGACAWAFRARALWFLCVHRSLILCVSGFEVNFLAEDALKCCTVFAVAGERTPIVAVLARQDSRCGRGMGC